MIYRVIGYLRKIGGMLQARFEPATSIIRKDKDLRLLYSPFSNVVEGCRARKFDAFQPLAERPDVRIQPQAQPVDLIVHQLGNLMESRDTLIEVHLCCLRLKEAVQLLVTQELRIHTLRVLIAGDLTAQPVGDIGIWEGRRHIRPLIDIEIAGISRPFIRIAGEKDIAVIVQ